MTLESVTDVLRWILLALGIGVLVWALLVRGRAKGKRRCPKCWYDMSATAGMKCPECGRAQKRERRFHKRRRSWRLAAIGCCVLALAYAADVLPEVKSRGWMFAVPRWALVMVTPFVDLPAKADAQTWLATRQNVARAWQAPANPGGAAIEPSLDIFEELYLHLYVERLTEESELWWWETRLVAHDMISLVDEPSPDDPEWNSRFARIIVSKCRDDIFDSRGLVRSLAEKSMFGEPALERDGRVLRWVFHPHAAMPRLTAFRSRDYEAETGESGEVWFTHGEGAGRWLKRTVYVPLEGPRRGRVTVELTTHGERRADGTVAPGEPVRVSFRIDDRVLGEYERGR